MGTRRQVRYEEYAANGLPDEDEDGPARSVRASAPTGKSAGPPMHSAAASHVQNDAYMDAFDDAYEDMMQKRGVKPPLSRDDEHVSAGIPPCMARATKELAVREQEVVNSTSAEELTGEWMSGPRSPEGTVHAVSAQPVMCMSLSGDNREVVVGSSDHALYTIPLSSGGPRAGRSLSGGGRPRTLYTKKFGHTEWVTCSTYLSDNRIVSGGMDSKLCLWDATGVKCEDLAGHSGSITLVKRLNDELLLSASYDKTVRVWNVSRKASSRQREVSSIKVGMAPILDASVLATSSSHGVLTGDRDGSMHIVDLDEGKITRKITGAHKGHATCVLASQFDESALCFSGGQDGAVRVWDLRQKGSAPAHSLELHIDRKSGKAGAVGFLKEPVDDRNILITGGADGTVKVLDKRKSFKTLFTFAEHMDFIYSLHVRGQLCFSGAGNGMLHVHDWKSGRLLYGLGANKAAVRAIETTPTQLIAAGDDGGVIVYDMQ